MHSDGANGPFGAANFRVVIGGVEIGFTSVSGLSSETSPGDRGKEDVLRNVVLRRGVDGSKDLWNWRQAIVEGKEDRRDVLIEHLDDIGKRVANAWILHETWPVR